MPDLSPQSLFQRLRAAWNQVSIKWRVFAVFAAFTILVLVLLWLFQTVFLDQFYEHTKKTELVSATETVQRHIDDASLESILDKTAQQGQIYVAVLYADGRLIGSDYSPDRGSIIYENLLPKIYWVAQAHGGTYTEMLPDKSVSRQAHIARAMVYVTLQQDSSGMAYMVFAYTILTPLGATV